MIMKLLMNLFTPAVSSLFRLGLVITATMGLIPVSARAELVCSASSASTVMLSWTAPGDNSGGTVVQYDIRYAPVPITEENWYSAALADSIPPPKEPGSLETLVVTGLTPSTEYYFAIKTADDTYNWSPVSSVVTRRTHSSDVSTPPTSVTDLEVVRSTPAEVVLSWTAPAIGTGGRASGYLLQYSHDSITTAILSGTVRFDGTPQPKPAGEKEQIVVTGLDRSTSYRFVLRSRNADFVWSGMSNIAGGTTVQSLSTGETHPYPNPFRPAETPFVTFVSIPIHASLLILTASGNVVRQWIDDSGEDIIWDGTNQSGNAVASGVYLWFVEGTNASGKLVVIR